MTNIGIKNVANEANIVRVYRLGAPFRLPTSPTDSSAGEL
jgi:hypothetical protein